MKVALIRYHDSNDINTRLPASLNRIRGLMPPLGLAYIAAYLERAGHEVIIIDAQAKRYSKEDVKNELIKFKSDVVGITTMTSNFKGALEASKIAKSLGMITVVGGPNVEVFPEETMSYSCIDYGILGEGEEAFLRLVEAIENKKGIKDINGIAYRENNKIVVGCPAIIENIDDLPFPARHLLPIKEYTSIISVDPMTTMITSRGCPFKCSFCFKQFVDKKVRFRNPISVVDEMELLVKDYKIKEILFYDDNIISKVSHIENICGEILKRKLKVRWESPARIDKVNPSLLKLMKSAGCVKLRYGVESGDERILKAMNKSISLEKVREAFKITHEAGIDAFGYFMVGYLNETRESFENTIKLIKQIKPDQIMINLTTPYPKTLLEKEAILAGKIPENYWRDFLLGKINTPMPCLVEDGDEWIKEAYRIFYLNPIYILGRLKYMTSFNQIKKHVLAGAGILFFKTR